MDQATLVGPDLSAGQEALAVLEAAGIKQIVALFAVLPEYEDWRLILSSPSLDQTHLLKAHDKVAEILQGQFVYTLPIIMILPTKDPFIRDLRKSLGNVGAGSFIQRGRPIWFGGQTLGKRYVTDAFIISFPGVIG